MDAAYIDDYTLVPNAGVSSKEPFPETNRLDISDPANDRGRSPGKSNSDATSSTSQAK